MWPPDGLAFNSGRKALTVSTTPKTLTSNSQRQSSAVSRSIAAMRETPALAQSRSTAPSCVPAASASARRLA